MKKNIFKVLLIALILTLLVGTVSVSAFESYSTYTYSIDGKPLKSPAAYSASMSVDSQGMMLNSFGGVALKSATDIVTDELGRVYIADKGNNRIVVLDKYYRAIAIIDSYEDEYGNQQTFSDPSGVFVTDPNVMADGTKEIYVCDTKNGRIVVFDADYNYLRTLSRPSSDIMKPEDFQPYAVAVDLYGRVFVVSLTCYQGVIVMSSEGDFTGFIGAQKVTYSVVEMLWRKFQTKEQIAAQKQNIPAAYNNLTIDDDGFIYVTSTNITVANQKASITSKDPTHSPIKKLNSAGNEIMRRNGFYDPAGEVAITAGAKVSAIIDCAVGPEGSWSLLDNAKNGLDGRRKNRIFTYDDNGNLLFAFGDDGDQLGNAESPIAITYQELDGVSYLLLLDNAATGIKLTVYTPTEYCETILSALRNANENKYSASIYFWQDVLTRNNNFDLAYIGIGKALYSQERYGEAMEMLRGAYETDYYSKAFNAKNKELLGKLLLPMIILIIVVLVLFFKFLGYAGQKNKVTALKVGRKTYWEELLYAFHLVFHPFDGFWDLKHEQRGSVRAGTTIMGLSIAAIFYQSIGKGYIYNPRGSSMNVFVIVFGVALVVMLWCVANWCLTCLFDGEGSFKDIYIATTYSLAPLPLFIFVSTLLTNFMDGTGASVVSMISTIGFVWAGLLLFFGMLVTHDYPMGKNILISACTIVAMLVITFVAVLFGSLVYKMFSFVIDLIAEIANRA